MSDIEPSVAPDDTPTPQTKDDDQSRVDRARLFGGQDLPQSDNKLTPSEPEHIARVVQRVAELPDRTSPVDWPDAMLVTAAELSAILRDDFVVLGSGYENGFDAGYAKGYADGLDEGSSDPRVQRIERGFKAMHEATNGEYSREDLVVMDALQAGRDFAIRLARREQHIQQLIGEAKSRDAVDPVGGSGTDGSRATEDLDV
jgi:hypothetical protein